MQTRKNGGMFLIFSLSALPYSRVLPSLQTSLRFSVNSLAFSWIVSLELGDVAQT